MTVGSGYIDPVEPGGEGSGTNLPATGLPFGTVYGLIGILGGGSRFDGHTCGGVITCIVENSTQDKVRLDVAGVNWPLHSRFKGLWLVLANGAALGTWYRISWVDR